MGLVGRMNNYSKKQWRSVFWRMRAAVKKAAAAKKGRKQHHKFQYDPSSYALNFDDGCCLSRGGGEEEGDPSQQAQLQMYLNNIPLVYVLWVKF